MPFTPGVDIVGVVDKLGEGVSTVEPVQMVAGCPSFDGSGYAEFICRPAGELVAVPSGLDSASAVCLVANYLTAHLALHESASMRSGDGVDAVFDPIGGARQLWRSYRALRKGGRLMWFGVAATSKAGMRVIPLSLLTLFQLKLIPDGRRAPLFPDTGKYPQTHNAFYRATLTELLELLAAGAIKPVVAERISLVEAARAHELLERGGYAGKVVLVTGA